MKIWGIPKTQTNTYVPCYQQNGSLNTSPMGKTSLSGDKFVSSVNFGTYTIKDIDPSGLLNPEDAAFFIKWKSKSELEVKLAEQTKKLTGSLSEDAKQKCLNFIDRIHTKLGKKKVVSDTYNREYLDSSSDNGDAEGGSWAQVI